MKLKRCRLTEKQQDRLLEFFVGEMTARTAADLAGVNKTTAAYFYHRLREIIAWQLDEASPLAGEIEADESYFGGKRKGKRGRGAAGKVLVFGILKRGGKVYTKMIPDNHINGIENFWNQAKRVLRKFNGVPKHHFHLFLKECEWRFNEGSPKQLLRQLKQWIKLANKR